MVVGGALGLLAAAVMIGAAIAAMGASPFSPRIERMQTSAGWAVFALGAVTTWGLGVVGARMGCDVLRDPTNPDQAGQLDKPPWKIDALCQEITNSYLGETGAQNLKKHPISRVLSRFLGLGAGIAIAGGVLFTVVINVITMTWRGESAGGLAMNMGAGGAFAWLVTQYVWSWEIKKERT